MIQNNSFVETHYAIPTASPSFLEIVQTTLVDDYSVGIQASKMADCFEGILALADSADVISGLRLPVFVRFVGKEDALLSASHRETIMRLDFNDLLYYHRE